MKTAVRNTVTKIFVLNIYKYKLSNMSKLFWRVLFINLFMFRRFGLSKWKLQVIWNKLFWLKLLCYFFFSCPADSGFFKGFCSTTCLCSGGLACLNGSCRWFETNCFDLKFYIIFFSAVPLIQGFWKGFVQQIAHVLEVWLV